MMMKPCLDDDEDDESHDEGVQHPVEDDSAGSAHDNVAVAVDADHDE